MVPSFSPLYFRREYGLGYEVATPPGMANLPAFIQSKGWRGFNVTTPYKEAVLAHVQHKAHPVDKIAAANTIVVEADQSWSAYNTDYEAAKELLSQYAEVYGDWETIWVLGTGGAARAVAWAYAELFPVAMITFFSRMASKQIPFPHPHNVLPYEAAQNLSASERKLVIQATPLGAFPRVHEKPPLPLHMLKATDVVWDLIYNPNPTAFLQAARERGCSIEGGLALLRLQAQKSLTYWFRAHKAAWKALSR